MNTFVLSIVIVVVIWVLWSRFSSGDPDRWHVDPADADEPGRSGWRMIGREAPRFSGDPATILNVLTEIALADPLVRLLDGDNAEGMITFVVRSKVFGFRDYVTVKAVAEGPVTKLNVISRARASTGTEMGRNRERLDRWLAELELRLT